MMTSWNLDILSRSEQ
ncbi:hypothetical protein BDFB_002502 [Asbolus verrucosus]|uniref:Uncharacterized protein n=1 Tax=Asbolus verrucosus TaxID=1661398 RepID=A0A482WD97_ASBVE|nr:hypothetical protein BDFB_002502 [Asbolus verrucosus]